MHYITKEFALLLSGAAASIAFDSMRCSQACSGYIFPVSSSACLLKMAKPGNLLYNKIHKTNGG
jgi:hypothetical protein